MDPADSQPPETVTLAELRRQVRAADPEPDDPPQPAAASPAAARLVFMHPPGGPVGCAYPVGPGPVVVGRDQGCEVVCPDESVSRRHAQIERRPDGRFQVTDLGSTNGMWVNQVRVRSASLRDGDYLQLGPCVYRFLAGERSEAEQQEGVRQLLDLVAWAAPAG
jgi:two-component system cell cycle response regulator